MTLLQVKNIASGYGKKQVLYNVSLNIEAGEVILLSGANGSGKSSLLKCIYGLLPLWSGEIHYDNENISRLNSAKRIEKGLVYVPQKGNVFDDLSAKENLEVCGMRLDKATLNNRIEQVLTWFPDLVPLLPRTPERFSGGEKQQLALACALLHRPRLLMLDEPTLGLSGAKMDTLLQQLQRIAEQENTAMLIVEHQIAKLQPICDKILELKLGELN